MSRTILAITCTVLLGTAACTSSTHGTGARVRSSDSSSSAAASAATSLTAQLLTPADLPAGWTVANAADPASLPAPPCVETVITALQTPTKARVQLVKGAQLPLLEQQIGRYDSAAQVTARYTSAVAAVDACHTFSFDYEGVRTTGSIGRLAFGSLGASSAAWHITLEAIGLLATGDVVLVAQGSELELLIYLNLGNIDPRDFTPLAMGAVAKMPK